MGLWGQGQGAKVLHDRDLWTGGGTEIPEMWDPRAGGLRPEAEGMAICAGLSKS